MIKRTNISSSLLLSLLHSLCSPSASLKSFHPFTSSENRPANYISQFTCLDSENKWNYCYFCIKHCAVNPKVRPLFMSGFEVFMLSLCMAPPVVTKLQHNCGMKRQIVLITVWCELLEKKKKTSTQMNTHEVALLIQQPQIQLQILLAQELMFNTAKIWIGLYI